MYRDDAEAAAAAAAARAELAATYRAAVCALPAGLRAALAARAARVTAGTIGLVAGAALLAADVGLTLDSGVARARVHVWVRGALIGAWAAIAIGYALARAIVRARYARTLATPLHSTGDVIDDIGQLRGADPVEPLRRMASRAHTLAYRSIALPLAALVALVPLTIYYTIAAIRPELLVVHPLSVPGRITRGDVLYLLQLRYLLWPFAIICFGAGRAARDVAEPRRRDVLRMHPLNRGVMCIYGVLVLEVAVFADNNVLRADWLACLAVLAVLWWALPRMFRRVHAEHVALEQFAGDRVAGGPRWLRWLKAATLAAPFLAISLLMLQLGSATGEITCDNALACTLVESTFATASTYRFVLAPGDRVELDRRPLQRHRFAYRLARRGTPFGSRFFGDVRGVRAAAHELTHAAGALRPPDRLRFGTRWSGLVGALLVLAGATSAAVAAFRGRE